ncbi:hypothetical protein Plhal703r1_c86g0174011 [Plasmopara halstedii]
MVHYSSGWKVTWRDLDPPARLAYLLKQPIWFHSASEFQYVLATRTDTSKVQRRSFCMVAEPQRSYRQHVANAFQIRSLSDFLCPDGTWPDVDTFARSHIDYRYNVVPAYQQYKWLRVLHTEATQVIQRLLGLCETSSLVLIANNTEIPRAPYVGVKVRERKHLVPLIPRSQLLDIVWKPPTPKKPHPIQLHHDRATADDIKMFARLCKRLRKILLPVYEDLQYRLAMRLLPVRSRFYFLQEAHPQIIYCIRDGCSAVETERHLFFECVLPSELWSVVFRDWSSFFTYTPKWIDIVLGRRPTPTDEWKEHIGMLGDLWQIMRAIVLHFVWTVRNDCLFRQRAPTPLLPALRVIYTTFSAHVRACMRRSQSEEDQESIKSVLNQLKCSRSLGGFMQANSQLFVVRFLK